MPTPSISVEGLDLVRRNLKAVNSQLPRELSKIHKQVAEPVAKRAQTNVRSRTGRLARSIKPSGTQAGAFIIAGTTLRPYSYARINHYGGYPGRYGGNPYLTDALDAETDDAVDAYDRQIHHFLERVWTDS